MIVRSPSLGVAPSRGSPPSHGGAIDRAVKKYGIPAENWLDLSTGINATAWPVPAIDTIHWQRLPLASELQELKQAAADYYAIPNPARIVYAPGTQALIQTIPFWFSDMGIKAKAHIIGPTYAEHAIGWQRVGFETAVIALPPETRAQYIADILQSPGGTNDIVIAVNPNNPDGGLIDSAALIKLAQMAEHHDKWLLIDEAFMDCDPAHSLCPASDTLDRLIILRSLGKFFGLAGVRLGCAIMAPALAADLEDRIGPWAIAGPTLKVAQAAFKDRKWQSDMRKSLVRDAIRLDAMIAQKCDMDLIGGTTLFRLYRGNNATKLADHLGSQGILVRLFDEDKDRIRFGLPGIENDWLRLQKALVAF